MITVNITRSEATCWCPLCGIQNVTDTAEINECEHFEGLISMNEFVEGDKNGILNEAYEAAYNLQTFNEEFDGTDEEYREANVEACKKHNVNPDQQNISAKDILESKLNDHYVLFYMGSWAPNPSEGIYLYNLQTAAEE